MHIFDAAKSGDRDAVFAWLDNQDDSGRVVGDARDVNEHCEGGGSVLFVAASQIDSAAKLAFVWELYARLPRKRVLRLRSLMLRGRAKPRRTGAPNVVARAFKLPNEMVWKVLAFWRVESEVTGEVI